MLLKNIKVNKITLDNLSVKVWGSWDIIVFPLERPSDTYAPPTSDVVTD